MKKKGAAKKKSKLNILAYIGGAFFLFVLIGSLGNSGKNKQVAAIPDVIPSVSATVLETSEPTQAQTQTPTDEPTPIPTSEPTPEPTNAPEPTAYPVLKKGSKGDAVILLQERLSELGYLSGAADGDFGSQTEKAVKDFQQSNGLADDGIAGQNTQEKLFSNSALRKTVSQTTDDTSKGNKYILNTSTMRIHDPNCKDVKKIAEKNYEEYKGSIKPLLDKGYKPCSHCNPN